jgi:hypothetical protein
VTYDRVFEMPKISEEMLTAKRIPLSLQAIFKGYWSASSQKSGDIYVKYLEPINI